MALEIELLTKLAPADNALKTPIPLAIFIMELVALSLAVLIPARLLLAVFIVLVKFESTALSTAFTLYVSNNYHFPSCTFIAS